MERLEAAGFEQYEISNVARAEKWSRHNLKYWQDGAWLGLGCGAHSTRGAERWKNVSGTEEYVRRVEDGERPVAESRTRDDQERLEDALFTGLRLTQGIDPSAILARFGVDLYERYGEALAPHEAAGRLVRDGGRLRLTRAGMLVANDVMTVFV
jgi:oxygen-independent coproporphyrinogen-3 oxidase